MPTLRTAAIMRRLLVRSPVVRPMLQGIPMLLGLDIGTTSVKAALVDDDGSEVAHGGVPAPGRTVPTGAEADPFDLLAAAVGAAEAAGSGAAGVAGVGV